MFEKYSSKIGEFSSRIIHSVMSHRPGMDLAGTRNISFHSGTVPGNPGHLVTLPELRWMMGIFNLGFVWLKSSFSTLLIAPIVQGRHLAVGGEGISPLISRDTKYIMCNKTNMHYAAKISPEFVKIELLTQ